MVLDLFLVARRFLLHHCDDSCIEGDILRGVALVKVDFTCIWARVSFQVVLAS